MSVPSGLPSPSDSSTEFSSLEGIYGPLFIGALISMALWGAACVQTYDYFINPGRDPLAHKFVVALLCLIATFDAAVNNAYVYHYLAKNVGNSYALLSITWSAYAISTYIVRSMFARRIYFVSGKNVALTLCLMTISSANFAVALISIKSFIHGVQKLPRILYLTFSLSIASDAAITLALSWLLYSARTGNRRTDTLVNSLIRYMVTTGLLVTINSTLALIFYVAMPNNMTYMGFYILYGQLYINAYFAGLNARENWSKGQTVISGLSYRTGPNIEVNLKSFNRSDNIMVSTLQTTIDRRTDNHDVA